MFFEKKYLCVLCGTYHYESKMKIAYSRIGVCHSCYDELLTTKDKSFDGGDGIKAVFSPYTYSGNIAEAVKMYKFGDMPMYGLLFGKMIYDELKEISHIWEYDCIIPVPLHQTRLRERGYNQSEIMAQKISDLSAIPIVCDGLFRVRETKRQSSLVGLERRENVRGAFYAYPGVVSGKRVILIDDIFTMGETIRACADALIQAGATEVLALTLCVSIKEENRLTLM